MGSVDACASTMTSTVPVPVWERVGAMTGLALNPVGVTETDSMQRFPALRHSAIASLVECRAFRVA